jgi:hypothetical protein
LIDLRSPAGVRRFADAANAEWRKLRSLRENRVDHLKQFCGQWYGSGAADESVPEPFLTTLVETLSNNLAASTPQCSITTPVFELKSAAFELELGVNQALEEMGFKTWAQRTLREALFGIGVIVIGVSESDRGFGERRGDVFAETVDPDDWIQDTTAKVWEHAKFLGYRVRTPVSDVVDDPSFDKAWRKEVAAAPAAHAVERSHDAERAADLGSERNQPAETEVEDCLDLWHFWLPREGLIVSLPGLRGAGDEVVEARIVRIAENTGPRTGPFEILRTGEVPGNCLPLPLVAKIRDVHDLLNTVAANNGEDASAELSVLAFERTAAKDADNLLDAPRNGTVAVDKLDKLKSFRWGGIQPANLAVQDALRRDINYYSGNIEVLGGQAVQANTLGQERMVKESASTQINAIRIAFADFVTRCIKRVAWYELTDPLLDRIVRRRITGTDRFVEVRVTPDRLAPLESRFHELNFRIKPYSMESRTPEEQFLALGQLIGVAAQAGQLGEMIGAQGIQPRFEGLLRVGARALGLDDLVDDAFDFTAPPTVPVQTARGRDPRPPQQITRQTIHTHVQGPERPDPGPSITELMAMQNSSGESRASSREADVFSAPTSGPIPST